MLSDYVRRTNNKNMKWVPLCGSQIIKQAGAMPTVFVVSDDYNAHFFGTACCHSAWACPRCTAREMAKKANTIACLIKAQEKWYHKKAFMVTFTCPHTRHMKCKDAWQNLYDTWRMFSRDGNLAKNNQNKSLGAYGQFRSEFSITEVVRVYEFTWGENGWHPHIHALFWVDENRIDEALEWEEKLNDRWLHCAEYCHKKNMMKLVGQRGYEKQRIEAFIEKFYRWARTKSKQPGVYFSKDKDGKIRVQKSSQYISGWKLEDEMTRTDMKTARAGHLTPFQMLNLAYEAKHWSVRDKWLKLFCEYAETTRKHKRCCFSPGCNKIADAWKQTEDYILMFKKKCMDKAIAKRVVFWFSEEQWLQILACESAHDDIRSEILRLATKEKRRELIVAFLDNYGINVSMNKIHPDEEFINSELLNKCA